MRRRSLVCEVPGCMEPWTERHHPFGRRAEPWASSELVLVLLCRSHHRQVTGEVGTGLFGSLRESIRQKAVFRMETYVAEVEATLYGEVHRMVGPLAATRRFELTRELADKLGIGPPGWKG